jgi:hypothetical protein
MSKEIFKLSADAAHFLKCQLDLSSCVERRGLSCAFAEQEVAMLPGTLRSEASGERTRVAYWHWRRCHRELFLQPQAPAFDTPADATFSASRRKEYARGVCSPE